MWAKHCRTCRIILVNSHESLLCSPHQSCHLHILQFHLHMVWAPPYVPDQKYSRLRCLLRVKGLVICFYLGWSGSILQFRQNIIKVGSKSWLLTCSSNITLSLHSLEERSKKFCNGYLSLLYFCAWFLVSPSFLNCLHASPTSIFIFGNLWTGFSRRLSRVSVRSSWFWTFWN